MVKKNLDKLFQEKLKDFSEIPDDKVWQAIETSLDKKKKSRKLIPIWWKLGGVAAILLVALMLINPFDDKAVNTPIVTDVNSSTKNTTQENNTDNTFENQNSKENQIVLSPQDTVSDQQEEARVDQVANTNTNFKEGLTSDKGQGSSEKERIQNQNVLDVQVANSDPAEFEKATEKNEHTASHKNLDSFDGETAIAESDASSTELENKLPVAYGNTKDDSIVDEIDTSSEKTIAMADKKETSEANPEENKKKSIFDAISERQQEEVVAKNSGSKWSAGPSIAPVYFSAMGEGSPVHSIFVPNSKSGDVNLSYGLSVAYEVSKKLSIRSGVHKVDYGYRTNDVAFSSSLENATSGQIDNIDYTLTSKNLVVSSKVNSRIETLNQNPFLDTSSEVSAASAAREGTMEQQFGYLEVPVELNYALVDNRFGINLIGGISSLFLVDNSISLNSGELTTEMGEANNVNAVNFSTNVGFGVNYKFTPKVQLNIEPVFKYQLNTFSETDGTFNPFSVGVYSGLSFKF